MCNIDCSFKKLSDNLSGVFPPTPGGSHIVLRKVLEPVIVGTASYYTYAVRRRGENGKEEGRGRWEEKGRREGGREDLATKSHWQI